MDLNTVTKYFKQFKKSDPRKVQLSLRILGELWPLIIVLAAATIEMGHVGTGVWKHYLLYDGDSLTLPLLRQSVLHHEPFQWIFSSQIFLFPEALLYFICGAITASVRASLVLNAYLNIVLLYALFRLVAWAAPLRTRIRQQAYALTSTLIVILFMLLERVPSINMASIATLYIFTTYYYGIILSGLLVTALSLLLINPARQFKPSRRLTISGLIVLVGVLTQLSNPLYSLQVALPYVITVTVLFIVGHLPLKAASRLMGLQFIAVVLGQLLRIPFKRFIANGLSSYINPRHIPQSLNMFHVDFKEIVSSASSLVEYLIILATILVASVIALVYIHRLCQRPAGRPPRAYLWLSLFASFAPITLIVAIVFTGTTLTRYFIPIMIFPLLGLLPLADIDLSVKLSYFLRRAAVLGLVMILFFGLFNIKNSSKLLEDSDLPSVTCLSNALKDQPAYGVGSFWTARSLEAYGTHDEHVLDVTPDLEIDAWLNNLGSYANHKFSFVLIEQPAAPYTVKTGVLNTLGPPDNILHCGGFDVQIFKPGTESYKALNDRLSSSLNYLQVLRAK